MGESDRSGIAAAQDPQRLGAGLQLPDRDQRRRVLPRRPRHPGHQRLRAVHPDRRRDQRHRRASGPAHRPHRPGGGHDARRRRLRLRRQPDRRRPGSVDRRRQTARHRPAGRRGPGIRAPTANSQPARGDEPPAAHPRRTRPLQTALGDDRTLQRLAQRRPQAAPVQPPRPRSRPGRADPGVRGHQPAQADHQGRHRSPAPRQLRHPDEQASPPHRQSSIVCEGNRRPRVAMSNSNRLLDGRKSAVWRSAQGCRATRTGSPAVSRTGSP